METPIYEAYAIKYGERMDTCGGMLLNADSRNSPQARRYELSSPELEGIVARPDRPPVV